MPGSVRPVTDERDALLAFLEQQRHTLRATAHGLTREQVTSAPTASTCSIAGLIKHAAWTERGWMVETVCQEPVEGRDYEGEFRLADDETLDDVLDLYDEVAAETERIVAELDLGRAVPVPDAPWFPKDVDAWSVRWVLLHLIEETARHAGHADIIRETIDGGTFYEVLAAAEAAATARRPSTDDR